MDRLRTALPDQNDQPTLLPPPTRRRPKIFFNPLDTVDWVIVTGIKDLSSEQIAAFKQVYLLGYINGIQDRGGR